MSLPISTIPGKRRVHRKRHEGTSPSPTPPPPPPPPPPPLGVESVIDISYGGDVLNFTVVFNTTAEFPLSDVTGADPAKWTARYGNGWFVGASLLLVDFNQLNVGMLLDEAQSGENEMFYSNAPSDISDALGRQLAAFSGFPL